LVPCNAAEPTSGQPLEPPSAQVLTSTARSSSWEPLPSPHKQAVQASASTLAPVPASSFTPAPVPVLGSTNLHRHTSAGRAPFRDDASVPAAAPSVPIPTRRSSFASVEGNLPLVFGRGEAAPPHDVSRQRVQDDHSDGFDFTLTATGQTGSLVLRSASDTGITAPAGGREEPTRQPAQGSPPLSQAGREESLGSQPGLPAMLCLGFPTTHPQQARS